jgi:hypothetical protein
VNLIKSQNDEKSCDTTAVELGEFYADLETRVEKEFPAYVWERSDVK